MGINITSFENQGSIVKGNVSIVGGTYNATDLGGGTATGIDTGGSKVLAAGLTNATAGATATPLMAYHTASGIVTITPIVSTDAGMWWAIVQL